jgi:hypothetical protein
MDLEWIIDNVNECDYVDYKKKVTIHLSDEDTNDFIMDVIAFANAPGIDEKFIIYGIEVDKSTREKTLVGIDPTEFKDSASYQQLIGSNVDPRVNFELKLVNYKGVKLGVIRIFRCDDPIYFAKNDRTTASHKKEIRIGDFWLRVSDHKVKGGRREYEIIERAKSAKIEFDVRKVKVTFLKSRSDVLEVETVGSYKKPSEIARVRIVSCLQKWKDAERLRTKVQQTWMPVIPSITYTDPFSIKPYEEMDGHELEESLSSVNTDYAADDRFALFEERGQQLALIITNDDIQFIEDATIRVQIPQETGLDITLDETQKSNHDRKEMVSFFERQELEGKKKCGPKIIQMNPWLIEGCLVKIRHGIEEVVFTIPPRMAFDNDLAGKSIDLTVTISARNLKMPIMRTLRLVVKKRQEGDSKRIE